MKRNMVLQGGILAALENAASTTLSVDDIAHVLDGDRAVVEYHIALCIDKSYVQMIGDNVRLTANGHDALADANQEQEEAEGPPPDAK